MPSRAAIQQAIGAPENMGFNTFGDTGPHQPDRNGVVVDMGGSTVNPLDMVENADGGVTVMEVVPDDTKPVAGHDENLADHLSESVLADIAEKVIEGVKVDLQSRQEWSDMLSEGMDLMGLKFETRSFPFEGASGAYDSLMLEAVLRNQAQTCGELLPAAGPVKTQIIGTPTEEIEQKSSRVQQFFNYYLLEGAPEWVEQTEQLFFWRAFAGSVFRKTYQDPILNRPVSPLLTPNQLVFSYFADSELETCPRITHILDLTNKEFRQRQISGFYRDIDLSEPEVGDQTQLQQKTDSTVGVQRPTSSSDDKVNLDYQFYEQHVDMIIEGLEHTDESGKPTNLPLPFIITVDKTSRRVLAVRRNWREGDESFSRISYFTHWKMLPGFGSLGLGYAHILGNPTKAATSLLRQATDSETLSNFPAGLRVKGMRLSDNNKMLGPCSFEEIDTGGLPIQQAIMTMPYKGANEVTIMLWEKGRQNALSLASMTELSVGDGRQDAPVGTTLALLEAANRMMSATIKNAHRSLKKELKLFSALFGQYLPETPYPFPVPGGQHAIMRADFSDEIDVIPVSDPNITSYAQRVTRAEMMLRSAMQAPQIHDLRAAYRNLYVEAGVDERKIEAILPAPQQAQPTDPLTENQNALTGKPLAVGAWQDHQAHIKAHQVLAEQVPNLSAHIAEHLAAAMRVNVEKLLGITLPPPGTKLPPEVENRLAVLVAQALEQLQSPQGQEPSPGQIAMAEIQVEAQKVAAQIEEIKARAATEAFKAQKKFITDEADRRERSVSAEQDRLLQRELAVIKSTTERIKANSVGLRRKEYGGKRETTQ